MQQDSLETIGTLARLKNWFIEANKIDTPAVELLAYTPDPEKLVAVAARQVLQSAL